jgi:hypothetical protein
MSDSQEEATEEVAEEQTDAEQALDDDVVLDLEAAEEYEAVIDQLQERVDEQQEQIEELNDLMLDLSVRVADDRAMGVCPDCHGAVIKRKGLFRRTTIECTRCGEVYHKY